MQDHPKRIQRKRIKGWRMPPNTVSVTRPGKWGNPFTVAEYGRETAIQKYREWLAGKDLSQLRGKNLACYCPLDLPCHGDVLLELANPSRRGKRLQYFLEGAAL